jgi:hypothetical protein
MISSDRSVGCPGVVPDSDIFYSNLSDAMHAAVQALTVLQLSHNTERVRLMRRAQLISLASSSGEEIERLSVVLGYMQQFLAIERSSPRLANIELPALITDAIGGVELVFREAGISLFSRVPAACETVLINAAKVSQAVGAVLLVAYGIAKPKDTVELTVSCGADTVEIEVRMTGIGNGPISADMSLRMGIAEANIRSQKGLLSYRAEPFCTKIELRNASVDRQPSS